MANWDEKIQATEKIADMVKEKEDPFEIYSVWKDIKEKKAQIIAIESINKSKKLLEAKLERLGTKIFEDWQKKKIEVYQNETNEKIKEYSESLESLSEEIENQFVYAMDEWIVKIKDAEKHENENQKSIENTVKSGLEFEIMYTLLDYNQKLPIIWKIYSNLKKERKEEISKDIDFLRKDIYNLLNKLNEKVYDQSYKAFKWT